MLVFYFQFDAKSSILQTGWHYILSNTGNNPSIDNDSYIIPSERADYSQEYVYDLRKNDRL